MNDYSRKFIEKAKKFHKGKYDYSKVDYVNNYTKVCIICPIHGVFEQTPRDHLRYGCRKCGFIKASSSCKKGNESFINEANRIHNNKYDYSEVNYVNNKTKVTIMCPVHGKFEQIPRAHLKMGCVRCKNDLILESKTKEFIKKSKDVHNDSYDYSEVNYVNNYTKVIIICPAHGRFKQTPKNHLNRCGCPQCGRQKCGYQRDTKDIFVRKANEVHDYKYQYMSDYIGSKSKIRIDCPVHGEFEQIPNNHLQGAGCYKCLTSVSRPHQQISDLIKKCNISAIINDREVISPYELDIFIPDLRLAIEVNGNYWHSHDKIETTAERQKHKRKCEICEDNGIRLIQIFEYEWEQKRSIVESILRSKLGVLNGVYARKCDIVIVTKKEHWDFMNSNHLQGGKNCNTAYGLVLDDELVSVMSFNKHPKYEWEITRFANKIGLNVVGGASRLFRKFVKEIDPGQVMTYADRRYSDGNLYKKLGFELNGLTAPNYCYVKNINVFSRQQFQKHKLKSKLELFNPNLTEAENMFVNGYRRLWDAGHLRFIWKHCNDR